MWIFFFFFQLYYSSKTKAFLFLWPKSCHLALNGSSCGEAKCQGPPKRSCWLGTFYCLHVYFFIFKKKKKKFHFITSCNETVAKKRFFYFLPLKSKSFISLCNSPKCVSAPNCLEVLKSRKIIWRRWKKNLKCFYNVRFCESNFG